MNNWPVFVKFEIRKRKRHKRKGLRKTEKNPLNSIEIKCKRGDDGEPEILKTTWMLIVRASLQSDCFVGALRLMPGSLRRKTNYPSSLAPWTCPTNDHTDSCQCNDREGRGLSSLPAHQSDSCVHHPGVKTTLWVLQTQLEIQIFSLATSLLI